MSLIEIIGWLGNLGFIFGAIAIAKKSVYGFHMQIFANVCYVIQSYLMKNTPLMAISLILIAINLISIYNWTKKEKKCKKKRKI